MAWTMSMTAAIVLAALAALMFLIGMNVGGEDRKDMQFLGAMLLVASLLLFGSYIFDIWKDP